LRGENGEIGAARRLQRSGSSEVIVSHPAFPRALCSAAVVAGAAALAAVAGCAAHTSAPADDDATTLAQDGTDTSATENDTETLSSSFIASTGALGLASAGSLAGGTLSAANLGDAARALYAPTGCLTVTSDATSRTATYVFDHCTGPYGLLDVTGTVSVTLGAAAAAATAGNRLSLDLVGTGLEVNRAKADFTAHADLASTAFGSRTMVWSAQLSGTTARGRAFTRTGKKTVTWTVGQDCVLVNGSSDGNVTGRNIHTDVINYSRCKGECPAAGSEIRITNATSGKTVDITCDGANQATFTGPNGKQTQITLACGL
jgi:hypothetical protein